MAAQSGVWFFDERPIDDERRRLEQGLRPISPDGVSTFAGAGIGMAFGANHIWAGEASAPQPRQSDRGLVITWDGRLDNRDDLAWRLDGRLAGDVSDAELALATFERWGIDGLHRLIGDWSLTIWDSQTRTLHLARDYMGVRPLYYQLTDRAVLWSTSLGELAIRAGCVDDLDEAFVTRFMALQFSTDVTPYKGISGVPTATCVSISAGGAETRRRFWQLEPGSIRYRDNGQYEEQLRALWAEAVGVRLRTEGTVWAELSGGLDSSSVVCMADALIKAGRVPASGLRLISHVTLESPEGDERRFIAEVERRVDARSEIVGVEAHAEDSYPEWQWISPLAPGGVRLASALRVREARGRLVLSGRVGDATMGCTPDNSVAVFDDLAAGRLGTATQNIRRWSRTSRKPFVEVLWGLAREAASPGIGAISYSHCPQARQLLAFATEARLESWPEEGMAADTHPFTHRPLVDYMTSIPAEQLSAPGDMRSLMRRAFAGLVPDRILRRTSKGYYPPAALRAARARLKTLPPVERLESVERGWIEPQRARTAIQQLGVGDSDTDVQLLLRLEHWLASRHRRGPAVIPTGKEVRTNEIRTA